MKLRTSYLRAAVSVVVMMAVCAVLTLNSFAAPELNKSGGDPFPPQDCTGTLTVKSGRVTINGNSAETGATVLTGSVIATNSNGEAIVDLGALGRVEIGDRTTVTLLCVANLLEIRTTCSKTEVEVRRGTLEVTSPKTETLVAGKDEDYDGGIVATSTGSVDVKIECEGRRAGAGLFIGPGLLGLLALVGVAVTLGFGPRDDERDGRPPAATPPSSAVR